MCQWSGHVRPKKAESQEAQYDDDNRQSDDTSCCFNDHDNPQRANDRIKWRYGAGAEDELLVIDKDVYRRNHGQNGKSHIKPVEFPVFDPFLLCRAEQVHQAETERQVDTSLDHGI